MKKILHKIFIWTFIAAMIFCSAAMTACKQGDDMMKNAPNYSNSEYRLDMHAHCSPTDGHYIDENGNPQYSGQDYRTLERYTEYKNCGFDTLLLLGNDPYRGEDFETSQLKKNLDNAQTAGLKVIVFDLRLHDLSSNETGGVQGDSLIGEGKQFSSQNELNAYVNELTAPYRDHPAFYGLTLKDEPVYAKLKSVGQVYRAIKSVNENIYVKVVLLPFMDESGWIPSYTDDKTEKVPFNAYKDYVEKFFEETQAKNLVYDDYPFRKLRNSENSEFIRKNYLQNIQYMSDTAEKHGAELTLIIQSFSMKAGIRKVSEADIRWQINTALSMGVRNIVYFTYWMHVNQQAGPGYEGKDSAIMDNFGNKILYDEVQKVNAESQKLAKIVLNYKYQKSYYNFTSIAPPTYFVGLADVEELDGIEEIEIEETTLINQMYDEEKGLYGYFILNETDPFFKKENKVTVKFADEYKYLMVVNRGEATYRKLDKNNSAVFELDVGDGCFVIPYN